MIKYCIVNQKERDYEVVERKGVGHPDTLCDAIAEKTSQLYSQYCLSTFGKLAHHWFDKVLLIGGESQFSFGSGEITKPYELHLMGKCVKTIQGIDIPIFKIFKEACESVLATILTNFNQKKHMQLYLHVTDYQGPENLSYRYRPRNINDLVDINDDFGLQFSNDCNLCVGYYPYSICEETVLRVEKYLNDAEYKKNHPEIGCDIKIFGRRVKQDIDILIRLPFVASHTKNKDFYDLRIKEITNELYMLVNEFKDKYLFNFRINVGDSPEKAYLTVTGSVADTGDVGCVGRGNRINGLITPNRPQSIEAAAGKNPIDHTGKLYSILANKIARKIYQITNCYVEVCLNSMKHKRLNDPDSIIISTNSKIGVLEKNLIENYLKTVLNSFTDLTKNIIYGNEHLW